MDIKTNENFVNYVKKINFFKIITVIVQDAETIKKFIVLVLRQWTIRPLENYENGLFRRIALLLDFVRNISNDQ